MIEFFVDMIPIGKARARTLRSGRSYTPKKTVDAERLIAWRAKNAMQWMKPLEGPVHLDWNAFFPIPASWPRSKKEKAYWHLVKPDLDNIEKLICDALNGICWVDDAQVCSCEAKKNYTHVNQNKPGIAIKIRELV